MSETKRKIFIIVVLFLVVLFGVGQFFAFSNLNTANQNAANGGAAAGQSPTQVIVYAPSAQASSTPVERGSCFGSSVAAPYRSDAWRCSVGNAISDPCFVMPPASGGAATGTLPSLLCGANPAVTSASSTFILQLTKKLPVPETPPGAPPTNWAWLVELTDGTLCTPFTGTRPFAASGEVAIYSCRGPAAEEDMIFGDLADTASTWTAEVGLLSPDTTTFPPMLVASATVPVAAVWQ